MSDFNYPIDDCAAHIAKHYKVLNEVYDIAEELNKQQLDLDILANVVRSWIGNPADANDKKLAEFLLQRGR